MRALRKADARVYIQRSAGWEVSVLRLFTRLRRRPFVYSSANDVDFDFATIAPGFRQAGLFELGAGRADAIVVQTAHQARLAGDKFPRVPRVVEIPSLAEDPVPDAGEPQAFLWAARLVDYKRPREYLDLAGAVPEASFRMVAVETYETDPALGAEVRERAAALPNLDLLPALGHDELLELVARSVALVSTSALEGMPNVFLEAWARGVPVLSFDFDPDGRIARHGLGAVADGSPREFAAAARRLWESRHDRDEQRAHLQGHLASVHGTEAVAERWAELLGELRSPE
jgi:glycosyltransferase involved in cell wall biosynthesis